MDKLTKNWHKAIITQAEKKLDRNLSATEKVFVISRLSYIALEFIEDTVRDLHGKELVEYLNSENSGHVHE